MNNFEQICTVRTDGDLPLVKYKSIKTGMTVFVSEFDGPLVNGYLCVATEADDDDGLPHTLEHVIFMGSEDYPFKDASFTTEVHHINAEGEDAGVVYCEMQARENTGESLCMLNMLRSVYPAPCGYRHETGGLMKNLRESTTNEKVKAYHSAFYRPENLCIIVTGNVKPAEVLKAIEPIELKVIAKVSNGHG